MSFNANMLRLAREYKGMTQAKLVSKLRIEQAVYSKYEKGIQVPSSYTIKSVSRELGFPVSFFMQDAEETSSGLVYHRKRSSLAAKIRKQLEAEARVRILEVQKLIQNGCVYCDIPAAFSGLSPVMAAKELRKHWSVPHGPIDNMVDLLEKHGVVVIKFNFKTDKLDGFFFDHDSPIKYIVINSEFSFDRLRFSLAHELGHVVLNNEIPGKKAEDAANAFASEFLMPEDEIISSFDKVDIDELAELKGKWKASMASLLVRAYKLGKITDSYYRKMWAFFSACGYRKEEPLMGIQNEHPSLIKNILLKMFNNGMSEVDIAETLNITPEMFQNHFQELISST